MSSSRISITEGLPIRRLGGVSQAEITAYADDRFLSSGQATQRHEFVHLPARIDNTRGWRLLHLSPTSHQLVSVNWRSPLFSDRHIRNELLLHSLNIPNHALLTSLASVFDNLCAVDAPQDNMCFYRSLLPSMESVKSNNIPNILYYRPEEASHEQYLLLYNEFVTWFEHPTDERIPSFINLYELVQVELDEERFLHLLRQAREAARQA